MREKVTVEVGGKKFDAFPVYMTTETIQRIPPGKLQISKEEGLKILGHIKNINKFTFSPNGIIDYKIFDMTQGLGCYYLYHSGGYERVFKINQKSSLC